MVQVSQRHLVDGHVPVSVVDDRLVIENVQSVDFEMAPALVQSHHLAVAASEAPNHHANVIVQVY